MISKTNKFFVGSLIISSVLLVSVPLCSFILSFVLGNFHQNPNNTNIQIVAVILSETTRAFITYYLYSVTENKGSKLSHGIKHGLLYSALIGSLYLILGYFFFS